MVDTDIGDMLLKFMLIQQVRPFCGVDFSNVGTEEYWERGHIGRWERWYRKMMGLTDSPYHACQEVT